jgi:hypothetical protein
MTFDSRVFFWRVGLVAVIPALLVARCGIWPSFPDELLSDDASVSTDARADAFTESGRDGGDAGDATANDATANDATANDAAPDVMPMSWYGFRACPAPPTTRVSVEPAFPRTAADGGVDSGTGGGDGGVDSGTGGGDGGSDFVQVSGLVNPRDINFDGLGTMIIAGRDASNGTPVVLAVDASGSTRTFFTSPQGMFSGARFLTNGNVLITGSYPMEASLTSGITLLDSRGSVLGRLAFPTGFPWASLAQDNGGFIVFDSTFEAQIIQFPAGPLPDTVPMRVDTSSAMPPPPTQQRSGAMSADRRHLFVVSQDNGLIHEYEVSAEGVINGASRRVYANLGMSARPRSIAFDECGNLYVTASAVVGEVTIGVLLRIPAGGGTPFQLATFEQDDIQRTIAFGAGPGFSNTHLYVADSSPQIVRRIPIGIPGQPIASPGTAMMLPRDM